MLCREKLSAYLGSTPHPKSIYLKASHQGQQNRSVRMAPKAAAKRKVEEIDDDDVYDAIKRLYSDEEPMTSSTSQLATSVVSATTSTCALQQEMSYAIALKRPALVVK